jgi:hypothetical protein
LRNLPATGRRDDSPRRPHWRLPRTSDNPHRCNFVERNLKAARLRSNACIEDLDFHRSQGLERSLILFLGEALLRRVVTSDVADIRQSVNDTG